MYTKLIGVDLGGTKFEAGRAAIGMSTHEITLEAKHREAVNPAMSSDQLLEQLFACIELVLTEEVTAIGIGVPGLVNPETGEILDIQNLPAWKKIGLIQIVEEKFKLPVKLNNDVNCFALGSHYAGTGKPYQNMVALSLGTGLGCGVITHGKLYQGLLCGAGEIGMIPYQDGIVEQYSGSFFFQREYGQSAKHMHNRAKAGEKEALDAFRQFGIHLGEAVRIVLFAYAPEAIVLGGSISQAWPYFERSMREGLFDFPYQLQLEQTAFLPENTPDLPLIGAAMLSN
ncbi:ROK family protein [Aureitalea marina]|uniref:Sugar kinase n=1 Tax=Aureitalea marina TaxID=930804 RepID=A0A2S7KNJ4_9FLAO|nr:ROK family protein [Aureitalea marina]PQB04187.1 sugar kinase [Aureitalea marina]